MIKEVQKLVGSKVLHFDSGDVLATLNMPIIDPDTGVVEAFWVKPMGLGMSDAVVQTSDILEFKKNIYVRSEQVLADPNEVIKLSELLSEERWFMGASVRSEAGNAYGKVYDLSFDTESYVVKQIYVQKTSLGLFPRDKRIFAWERILEVLPAGIIIDDDSTKKDAVMSDMAEPAAG